MTKYILYSLRRVVILTAFIFIITGAMGSNLLSAQTSPKGDKVVPADKKTDEKTDATINKPTDQKTEGGEDEFIDQDQLLTLEEKENLLRELRIKRAGSYAFGFSLGLIPDLGELSTTGPNIRRIHSQLDSFTLAYKLRPSNASPEFESFGEMTSQSKSVVGMPIQMSLAYYGRFTFLKFGLSYVMSSTATNAARVKQYDPDGAQQSSLVTGSETLELTSQVSMSYFEVPATFAVRIVNIWASSFYIGAGPSYFVGGYKRVTSKNSAQTVNVFGSIADADVFFAQTVGLHFLIGGEVFITRDIALTAEMQYSYGASASGQDQVVTKDAETMRTSSNIYSASDSPDLGAYGYEQGSERSPIQFGGFAIQIGVRYLL